MQDPGLLIISIAILIFSVIAHELGHGYAAESFGDKTARFAGRLTWNPISHIDPIGSILMPLITSPLGVTFGWAKPVPYNPNFLRGGKVGEFSVAGAGVLVNFLLALIFGLIVRFFGEGLPASFIQVAVIVVITNLVLGVFNVLPVPPLDGSKMLFSIFPQTFRGFEYALERFGAVILILPLLLVFFFWGFISPLISYLVTLFTGIPLFL